jgi:hypothetical protein
VTHVTGIQNSNGGHDWAPEIFSRTLDLEQIANAFTMNWIPAFAGMTFLERFFRHARAGGHPEASSALGKDKCNLL